MLEFQIGDELFVWRRGPKPTARYEKITAIGTKNIELNHGYYKIIIDKENFSIKNAGKAGKLMGKNAPIVFVSEQEYKDWIA